MQLNLKSFSQLVTDMGAALQGSATALIDISVGSVIRAIFEANAAVVLWMQWLVLQVLSLTRASTSVGPDLDSWMADFTFTRLGATPSTGIVTLSRFATNLSALVPVGTVVKTADGTQSFSVTADISLSTWQQTASGYVIPSGVSSVDVPATCLLSGSAGNVQAGTITLIASSLPGVDQVNNASIFTNGSDAEGDQAFRNRFQNYLSSLSRATLSAVNTSIVNVQQGLLYVVKENVDATGNTRSGSFLVVLDDGSGHPSSALLSQVATAVDQMRPIGTTFSVIPPSVLLVNVTLTISVSSAAPLNCGILVQSQLAEYLNAIAIETSASLTRVAQYSYMVSPTILNVTDILLNGSAADVAPPANTIVKAGQVSVSVNAG